VTDTKAGVCGSFARWPYSNKMKLGGVAADRARLSTSTPIRRIGSDCYARRKRPCRSAEQRHELAPVAGGTRFA